MKSQDNYQILALKLIKNIEILTKNIYETIMMTLPMTHHHHDKLGQNKTHISQKRFKDMNNTVKNTSFERKEKF
jgi:hypothetical protein